MNTAYAFTWTESEAGWGCRPDGTSVHTSIESAEKFVKDYWARQPKEVPSEYSRPDTDSPVLVEISQDLNDYLNSRKSKTGDASVRLWTNTLKGLKTWKAD